jgi:hypothetical protein
MLVSTVSPLELAWTILGVLGFCFSLSLGISAGCDMLTVEEAIQADPPTAIRYGPRWWLALSPSVSNLALCLIWIGYIYLGTRAMADPQITYPPELRGEQTLFGAILLGSEVILLPSRSGTPSSGSRSSTPRRSSSLGASSLGRLVSRPDPRPRLPSNSCACGTLLPCPTSCRPIRTEIPSRPKSGPSRPRTGASLRPRTAGSWPPASCPGKPKRPVMRLVSSPSIA